MDIQNQILQLLAEIASDYNKSAKIALDQPKEISHGDYSSNLSMVLAKELGRKPVELAEEIVKKLSDKNISFIEKVEVAGPGFINFYLNKDYVQNKIISTAQNGLVKPKSNGKNILIEYTDPNTFKAFHIGHMMSNAIGESLSRLIENSGSKITRICYPADIGLHIAKAIWAIKSNLSLMPKESDSIESKTDFLGKMYVLGIKSYENDSKVKLEIDQLNKIIYEKSDNDVNQIYKIGRKWSLDHFEQLYKVLGTKFDDYIYESEVADIGLQTVKNNLEKGIFENSDGAIVFKGEEFGLHTRVFVNTHGLPTYEAKDLGLNIIKFNKYKDTDQSIVITASEQNEYFKVICKVLSLVDKVNGNKTLHIGHGMMRFASGKMSSRTGNVITAEDLLRDIKELVKEKISDRNYSSDEVENISSIVAVGAIKFTILRSAIGGNIVFDSKASISFEGDSGPYLQYSAVRANSILEKAQKENIGDNIIFPEKVVNLERVLIKFDDVVGRASRELSPHFVTQYLIELAGEFNSFYGNQVVVDKNDKYSPYYVYLTKAFYLTLNKGLSLLGIGIPTRM